jgi:hypothetical protein
MNDSRTSKTGLNRRLWNWTTKGWVAEVPEDIACCEFDCRVLHCGQRQWATCKHRLHHMAVIQQRPSQVRDTMQFASAS